jgi:hypothetical protein
MIELRDFVLYVLPVLIALGGWLHAFSLRKQARRSCVHSSRAQITLTPRRAMERTLAVRRDKMAHNLDELNSSVATRDSETSALQ